MNFVIRKKPLKLLWLEALLKRLRERDPEASYFIEQFRRLDAGFAGEQRVDKEWYEIICPNTFFVLHNIVLANAAKHTHQLDTLFICNHFMLVVEIKNISGKLDFDGITYQCTRTKPDGTVEGFPNAITQIQRHIQFIKIISKNYYLPIEGAVIFSNPSAIIENHPNTVPIFHVSGLQSHIQSLYKKHPKPILTDEQLTRFVQLIRAQHQPQELLTRIDSSRFRHGVLCPKCKYKNQMFYYRGIWKCSVCQHTSKEIFAEALQDYQLLVNRTITNSQLRKFFGIESSDAANRLLRKFNFPSIGTTKNRVYHLPENLTEYMKQFF
ncbi:nuclease-related domain-containing protein [Lysinibacillus sp. NPDC093197]|uniref:nuclease-related domain-containing protein n=1 Tax=Lysinibacillus sp. NPDC093197 TaxID=3364132 RepID=UPI0037F5E0CE